jgi:23S rRNA pseudouridine1911/1915/1917 synthase
MELKILYEDNHLIAVDKEPGVLSQKDSSGIPSLIEIVKDYLKDKYRKPGAVFLGPVHRLDRPASGVILFARTSKAADRLRREFTGRSVMKMYIALVESGRHYEHDTWIECEDRLVRKRGYSEKAGPGSRDVKTALLRFMALVSNERYALLLVNIKTGRKHQIRAQLAAQGTPIVGDTLYGSREPMPDGSICLHSYFLGFAHPTLREPVEIFSSVPERISDRINIDGNVIVKIIRDARAGSSE